MNITFFCTLHLDSAVASEQNHALSQLVSIGQSRLDSQTMAALICQQFGVQPNPDYPLAALSSEAESQDYYLQANPVHLILQRDAFALSDPAVLVVSHEELQALSAALNQHFMQDGLSFELCSHYLLLRLNTTPKISTTLPEKVVGRNVYDYLPQGADASYWNKIINEIQMLLHEHPINQQRESMGLPVINSIWLSGGGCLPKAASSALSKVYSDIAYVQKLAQLASVDCEYLPIDANIQVNQGDVVIALNNSNQLEGWAKILLKHVQNGARLQLNLVHQDTVLISEIKPRDAYKLWLWKILGKHKSLMSYFQAHYSNLASGAKP